MSDSFVLLLQGFSDILRPALILQCAIGSLYGIFVGVLPGLGATAGIAVLLPAIFGGDPLSSMVMLAGVFFGATYGGTITAVLINIPGSASNICTGLDGHPLAKRGRAGAAIGMGTISSAIGGTIGVILLTLIAVPLARWALNLGPAELFSVYLFAFMSLIGMEGNKFFKSMLVMILGLLFSTIGQDVLSGDARLTYGSLSLLDGIDFVPAIIGLFGLGEILSRIMTEDEKVEDELMYKSKLTFRNMFPNFSEVVGSFWCMVRSAVLGFFVGVLPGAGGSTASFFAYQTQKAISKEPEKYGTGVLNGIAAAEAANSACFAGTYVPLFALGIPGSSTSAVLLGALIILGTQPGPMFFTQNPALAWGIIASMYIANIVLLVVCSTLVPFFVWLLKVSKPVITTTVVTICFVGVFSVNRSMMDLWVMILFGILGYIFHARKFSIAPLILAMILGNDMEKALRRALVISMGNPMTFVMRPISRVFFLAAVLLFVFGVYSFYRKRKQAKKAQ